MGDPQERNQSALTSTTATVELPKPPMSYEEYILMEGIEEWPQRLTSELPLTFEEEAAAFGSKGDIVTKIKEAAPIDMSALDKIQGDLAEFEEKLMIYARQFLQIADDKNELALLKQATLSTDSCESSNDSVLKSKQSKDGKRKHKQETIFELKNKSVDYCEYPGFIATELNELPSSLEAPQILHRVTKALRIPGGFKRIWRKIFISEASLALVQDSFWWFFLDNFDRNPNMADKSRLFDRIADSFAALFFSIHPETKDKFFEIYPEALSQATYSTFFEAFPESRKLICNNDFKQYIVNTIEEWIHGSHPLPETFVGWNYSILEATLMPVQATDVVVEKSIADSVMQAAVAMNDPTEIKMDLSSFEKSVKHLGRKQIDPDTVSKPVAAKKKLPPIQSHPMGRGPAITKVPFDIYGSSPLMAHFLRLHRGVAPISPFYSTAVVEEEPNGVVEKKKTMTRTEIRHGPHGHHTYQDFIDQSTKRSGLLKFQFEKIKDEARQEVVEINHRTKLINYQIDKLEQEFSKTRSTLELKLMEAKMMDRIVDVRHLEKDEM